MNSTLDGSSQILITFCYTLKYNRCNWLSDDAGSREQAYVYALSAASLTQSIAKACTSGVTSKCSCGPMPNEPPPGEFKWGGCGDDISFGMIFSKWFTDAPWNKRKNSKRMLVNMHNSAVGRKVGMQSLVVSFANKKPTSFRCGLLFLWSSAGNSLRECFKALLVGSRIEKRNKNNQYTTQHSVERTSSILPRGSHCVSTLSKSFTHNIVSKRNQYSIVSSCARLTFEAKVISQTQLYCTTEHILSCRLFNNSPDSNKKSLECQWIKRWKSRVSLTNYIHYSRPIRKLTSSKQ